MRKPQICTLKPAERQFCRKAMMFVLFLALSNIDPAPLLGWGEQSPLATLLSC